MAIEYVKVFWVSLALFVSVKSAARRESTGRHIVVLRDGVTKQRLEDLVSEIREADEDPSLPDVHCVIHEVMDTLSKILIVSANKEALNKIGEMKEVSYIDEDKIIHGATSSHLSWALDRLDQQFLPLDQRYQPISTGAGVDVYVVDSGIHYSHDEFQGRALFGGYDKVPNETIHMNGSDCHGHGTHLASVIGGKTLGVAKQTTLYSVRVLNCNNQGSSGDLVSSLEFVAKRIIQSKRPSVINLSLITFRTNSVDKVIKSLYDKGIPIVAAAGNGKTDACIYSPANSPLALTVAGTTIDDSPFLRAPGTNFGKCIDVFAPADYILGADVKCNSCCRGRSGTSVATALVSGVLALYLEKEPHLTSQELYNKVLSDSTNGAVNMAVDGVPVQFRNQTVTKLVKVDGSCGGDFVYESRGRFSSPHFPLNYPHKLHCVWRIVARVGEDIKVIVEEADLASNDTLTIIDGDVSSSTILGKLSSTRSARSKFRSHSRIITVILVTDGEESGKGFHLKYTKHLVGEKTLAQPATRPATPTPVPLPTSQPLTETHDSKAFIQVPGKNVQSLVNKWEGNDYHLKHLQPTQFLTYTGKLKTAYNVVFSNLSLDKSYFKFEVNSTELLKHYRNSRKNYVVTEITQITRKGQLLYSVIFTKKNERIKKQLAYWNDSLSEHKDRMKKMRKRGYLLKAQTFSYKRGQYSISSIYEAIRRGWIAYHNLTLQQSLDHVTSNQFTHVMTSISTYNEESATKFVIVLEQINHPDYHLWTIWNRTPEFTMGFLRNYTSPKANYEATAIVGFQTHGEIRYIVTLGIRKYYYS